MLIVILPSRNGARLASLLHGTDLGLAWFTLWLQRELKHVETFHTKCLRNQLAERLRRLRTFITSKVQGAGAEPLKDKPIKIIF